jgi:hypothetical protein
MFGCNYIPCGLIPLRFWICVLMILATEDICRTGYIPVSLFVVAAWSCCIVLLTELDCSLFIYFFRLERFEFDIYLLQYTLLALLP